jgi:hypothetical protein
LPTDNYASFVNGLELSDLPKTLRDAILATRKLGISYLWIDSLCIIQDSHTDWTSESVKMRQIYRNSWLNLAAAMAKDSIEGLFVLRAPLQVAPCYIKARGTGNIKPVRSTYEVDRRGPDKMILCTRAWVFQE